MGFILAKFNIKWGSTCAKTSDARSAPTLKRAAYLPSAVGESGTSGSEPGKTILGLAAHLRLKGIHL